MQKDFQKKKFAIINKKRNIVVFSKKKINPKLRAFVRTLPFDGFIIRRCR